VEYQSNSSRGVKNKSSTNLSMSKKVRLRGEEAIIMMRSLSVEAARFCSQAWKQLDFATSYTKTGFFLIIIVNCEHVERKLESDHNIARKNRATKCEKDSTSALQSEEGS
jgi:hypothetical protein